MTTPLVYHPGLPVEFPTPLARFLPRLPRGAVRAWLENNIKPGSWVIDPYGASPQMAIEAAQAGYRILVASNNPINRFVIKMTATPPTREEMVAILADLASSKRGEERIEPHILELYRTECDNCGQGIFAEAFLWEKDAPAPYARIYTCPHCEHSGEYPTTQADTNRAEKFSGHSLHRARALERVASSDDPDREHVEEALDAYLPRAVYALFTIINKLDGLGLKEQQRTLLEGLLLTACDRGSTLWQASGGRARPKLLTTPSRFFEHNIWFALEKAIDEWTVPETATVLTYWPDLPPESGGICLYEGRMKDLAESLGDLPIQAVVSAFPRQNQAFWALSALWTGWLWGKEEIGPFISMLRRRRYDWAWHANALQKNLSHLAPKLKHGAPFFGLVTESESGFDISAAVAADLAGFKLDGLAMRRRAGQTQFIWHYDAKKQNPTKKDPANLIKTAAQNTLKEYGQPTHYLRLQNAALINLSQNDAITRPELSPPDTFSETRSALEFGMTFHSEFTRYDSSEHSLEVGRWWLRDPQEIQSPLADRVEMTVVNYLVNQPDSKLFDIDKAVCEEFPGLQTPDIDIVTSILNSYAIEDENKLWSLRPEDSPKNRREDLAEIDLILTQLGEEFGYQVEKLEGGITWLGETNYQFHITASSVLGKILLAPTQPNTQNLIVLPGSRAELVMQKLGNDPRLAAIIEKDWRLLKFRWVRRLSETPGLNPETFRAQFDLDPLSEDDPQLPLL